MDINIILAGVGGQGILSISAVIGVAAMEHGMDVKQSEVHGMSQRGGAVVSHLRLSDQPVFSSLIPMGEADMILAVEPMELLRYKPFMKKGGFMISNTKTEVNIPNYPKAEVLFAEIEKYPNHVLIDAEAIAKKMGNVRAANMVMLGAASDHLNIEPSFLEEAIRHIFERKGERVVQMNLDAFHAGRQAAEQYIANYTTLE